MAKRTRSPATADDGTPPTTDYRHSEKRKNIPPAQMASEGQVPKAKRVKYAYSPHLDPILRFDPTARADKVKAIVEKACAGKSLTADEQEILRGVGEHWSQPWLEWAGKQEEQARGHFEVDPIALHIHERISSRAILANALRQDAQRSLFADPEQSYAEAVQFYKHDVDWANRMILGDSLQVMSSLAYRENLAGKVQMIYIDPPYGIRFASNFQPEVRKRDVRDGRDEDLTREPETVRAFRDTWHLGIHSYFEYLRQRIHVGHELLRVSGSMFIQISEENIHRVRSILDETFGAENFCSLITFRKKTMPLGSDFTEAVSDYLLWYAKDRDQAKSYPLFVDKPTSGDGAWGWADMPNGLRRRLSQSEVSGASTEATRTGRVFQPISLLPAQYRPNQDYDVDFAGKRCRPPKDSCWKTDRMDRLVQAERVHPSGNTLRYVLFHDDYPVSVLTNLWADSVAATDLRYVVQTSQGVIERCMLMTTDPGDIVLDPTCGSGTTAYLAEQWGRRWITTDTSRVALSIARQRVLTASFEHYRTKGGASANLGAENPSTGFKYKSASHITLGSIAQNSNLDPIFARHKPILSAMLDTANAALKTASADLRAKLRRKLEEKIRADGKRSITDADRRRWILPPDNRDRTEKLIVPVDFAGWYEWEVPFDTDPDWPKALQDAVTHYRKAWRAKMDEVNKCIADNAEQEELVDQPEIVRGVTRVSGPFTVEGVMPEELALTEDGIVDLTPNDPDDESGPDPDAQNRSAYLKEMTDAIKRDGVLFPNNQKRMFSRVEPLYESHTLAGVHAEGAWDGEDEADVAICFGPQYGPVTAYQVEELIRSTKRYAHLVIAGFSFDPEATAIIEQSQHPRLKIHMAHIRPDMNPGMRGLLKDTPNSQLFTVFGMPAVDVAKTKDGEWQVKLEGVDIYDPVENTVRSTKAEKVAAWFLDSDFDGRCFCICQA
ncbi:MAG: site-specific DNA-methyltransferase, partial [Planctomycetes bacterium]|nr:site-specific DNA-methyltransferase [Planctomycetota bacterium]